MKETYMNDYRLWYILWKINKSYIIYYTHKNDFNLIYPEMILHIPSNITSVDIDEALSMHKNYFGTE